MATCYQRLVVLLLSMHLLVTCVRAIPSPAATSVAEAKHDDVAKSLDSDTGDDRELKSDDDGYDFFMIDQLFLNNPQYRQLISDLQAHTFGSNWRRKRDVADSELPDAFRGEITEKPRTSTSVPASSTSTASTSSSSTTSSSTSTATTTSTSSSSSTPVTSTTTSNAPTSGTSVSAAVTPLDVESNRDITSSSTNLPKAAALTSTKANVPSKSSSTTGGTTTPLVTSTPSRGSTVSTSASYGSSGSTEPPTARNATLEMTTAAAPIRASTPRRLSHKNGSNKNKNKLSSTTNKPTSLPAGVGPNAVNVNKVSVSSNAVASSSSSSGSSNSGSTPALQADVPVAIPATENGTSAGLAGNNKDKTGLAPTKYHYYPHNQHIYFLPECAIQQVCNAVYVRLNYTQPLCACPPRYRDPCSASLNEDDNHTIKLVGNQQKRAITLAKTCENTNELRDCRAPKDWSILALQNTRTGKSHYLVICKCPPHYRLEGPLAHDQPTYAGLPGINVYGMLCVPPETSSYYASKPAKTPSNSYNKWKIPSRQPINSYRGSAAGSNVDAETESESRTYQNSTDISAAGSEE
ncbi:serine-rich adhesin for platelets-like [Anopheles albimanus]|uniref:Uncharacterized protein n=1 Tax=Anopheles albimanus TaxID=7167 RepID=A0A1I8JSI5_ANOAL|nr:serine-rich adhesin for platelets-like [Anopheles albimanus]XP_035777993.1 serine-rich adhesin for platelets-like [Anopheles albimanus]